MIESSNLKLITAKLSYVNIYQYIMSHLPPKLKSLYISQLEFIQVIQYVLRYIRYNKISLNAYSLLDNILYED